MLVPELAAALIYYTGGWRASDSRTGSDFLDVLQLKDTKQKIVTGVESNNFG